MGQKRVVAIISHVITLPQDWRLELSDRDLREIACALDEEMDRGLARQPGAALAMIPAYVGLPRRSARGRVLCLDAGGTNVRAALVTVRPDELVIGPQHRAALPGTGEVVDHDRFFRELAELLPEAARVSRIGFCFSYPAEVLPDGDAILLRWTKEVRARGVEGARVGEGLRAALRARGRRGAFCVVVLNDTVTTMMAATRDPETRGCTRFIGVVVGTGTNMAAFEPLGSARLAAPTWKRGPLAFNLESGNFRSFPRGVLDERLAQTTRDPDHQWFEKAVSGQYLGELCYLALRDLAIRGGVPHALGEAAARLPPPPTAALSRLLAGTSGETPWERLAAEEGVVRVRMTEICRALCRRSARLCAAGLMALVERAARSGVGNEGPTAIAAEGSVFYGVPGYRDVVLETLHRLTPHPVRLVRIEDANLKGAALAALGRRE
jgi:hexokinase